MQVYCDILKGRLVARNLYGNFILEIKKRKWSMEFCNFHGRK